MINSFRDLKIWQKAMDLVTYVYEITNSKIFDTDWDLRRQCRKSAVSIPSNIAEGFERQGNKEFTQFLSISLGSGGELYTQLLIAKNIKFITEEEFQKADNMIAEIRKMNVSLQFSIKKSELKGLKYKSIDTTTQTN